MAWENIPGNTLAGDNTPGTQLLTGQAHNTTKTRGGAHPVAGWTDRVPASRGKAIQRRWAAAEARNTPHRPAQDREGGSSHVTHSERAEGKHLGMGKQTWKHLAWENTPGTPLLTGQAHKTTNSRRNAPSRRLGRPITRQSGKSSSTAVGGGRSTEYTT